MMEPYFKLIAQIFGWAIVAGATIIAIIGTCAACIWSFFAASYLVQKSLLDMEER